MISTHAEPEIKLGLKLKDRDVGRPTRQSYKREEPFPQTYLNNYNQGQDKAKETCSKSLGQRNRQKTE